MNISTSINTSAVMAAIKKARPSPKETERALGRAATGHILDMLKRVDGGVGLNGRFKAYHPKYAEYRAEKGRSVSPVNLQFNGEMLKDLTSKSSPSKAVISFISERERLKGIKTNKQRPWFGVTDSEEKKIASRFKREIFR